MPKTILSDSVKDLIIEGWSNGESIEAMARKHQTHTIKVADAIKERFGGVLPKRKRKCRAFSEKEVSEMVEMYQSGRYSAKQIYTKFKTRDEVLIEILEKRGIKYMPLKFAQVDEKTEAQIVNMYKEKGMTSIEIPKALGLPYQRVRKVLLKNGLLDGKSNRLRDKYSKELIASILTTYQDKSVSVMDVSKIIGLSYASIRNILLKNGVQIRKNKEVKRAPIPEKVDRSKEVVEHYLNNGKFMNRAAKALNLSQGTIARILKQEGLYESSRYVYNENYFSEIDSHEKAYILGFLITDGCNHEDDGSVSLTLHSQDKEILEQITRKLSPDKVLHKRIVGNQTHFCMQLSCRKMSKDLARLGIVQAKTFKIKVQDWMTGEFANSAILGMMDGDGSFYYRERFVKRRITPEKSWTFSFIGLRCICEMMKNVFRNHLGINACVSPHSRYKNNVEKPLCTVRVYGNRQNKILMDWLYKDSPLYMKRKHDNYLDMLAFLQTKRVNQFC